MNKRTNIIFSILLITVMMLGMIVVGMLPVAAADNTYAGDTKITRDETWYNVEDEATEGKVWEIYNAEDLLEFAYWANCDEGDGQKTPNNFANQTVKLMADIDLNPNWSASEHGAKGIAPTNLWLHTNCDLFGGTFDGNGHTISGLYRKTNVNGNGNNNAGMFVGLLGGATVKNFALINSYFEVSDTNRDRAAAIAPSTGAGEGAITISNVYTDAIIVNKRTASKDTDGTGGILGANNGKQTVNISDCVFAGSVYAEESRVGGIVGTAYQTGPVTITNCINMGSVRGNGTYVGGILGKTECSATITACVNLGRVSTGGDLFGTKGGDGAAKIENSYYVNGLGIDSPKASQSSTNVTETNVSYVALEDINTTLANDDNFTDWAVYGDGTAYEVMLPKYFTSEECKFIDSTTSKDVMKKGIAIRLDVYCDAFGLEHTPEADDNDCETAVKCSNCKVITTPAKEHTPVADQSDCTIAVKCSNCEKNAIEAKKHTPEADDGNCLTAVECSVCGTETTPAAAAHTPEADDGNCTTAIECSVCGTETTPAAAAHTPEADDGNCTTAVECSVCGTETTPAAAAHTPEADDGNCTTAIECSVCDQVAVAAATAHTPAADDGDCTTAVKCSACDKVAVAAKDAHTYGDDGKCTACDAVKPADGATDSTDPNETTASDGATDTTAATDDGATSSKGWIIGVVAVVVVVLAIGIGTVVFVNKKKSTEK